MSFICLISLMVYTLVKSLLGKKLKYSLLKENGKKLRPQHPVRCNITGPSSSGKSVFLTNLI